MRVENSHAATFPWRDGGQVAKVHDNREGIEHTSFRSGLIDRPVSRNKLSGIRCRRHSGLLATRELTG
jgi:hypothetical protein